MSHIRRKVAIEVFVGPHKKLYLLYLVGGHIDLPFTSLAVTVNEIGGSPYEVRVSLEQGRLQFEVFSQPFVIGIEESYPCAGSGFYAGIAGGAGTGIFLVDVSDFRAISTTGNNIDKL